jgi:hypothetical protein
MARIIGIIILLTSFSFSQTSSTIVKDNLIVGGNAKIVGELEAEKVLQDVKSHCFYAFEDSSYTLTMATQNVWYHVTNLNNNLFTKVQDGQGFVMSGDTIHFFATDSIKGSTPHLVFHYGLDGDGENQQTYQIRMFNVTKNQGLLSKATATAFGGGTEIGMSRTAYITNGRIGDKYIMQIRCITGANKTFDLWDGSIYAEVSHY